MVDKEEKVEKKVEIKKIKLDPEAIASRERAHAIKVAKFLAGGEF